jgi:hypothetical protein
MEQNNLEQVFKNKLNSREIAPSNRAWEKLEANLNASNKSKKSFYWMAIAASFVGFIAVSAFYFIQTTEKTYTNTNGLVIKEKNSVTPIANQPIISNKTILETKYKIAESKIIEIKKGKTISEINIENNVTEIPQTPIEQSQETVIAIENNSNIANAETPSVNIEISNPTITVNPKNLLSQVEEELKLTFRQKILKTIAKNYKATKEILVARNQQ